MPSYTKQAERVSGCLLACWWMSCLRGYIMLLYCSHGVRARHASQVHACCPLAACNDLSHLPDRSSPVRKQTCCDRDAGRSESKFPGFSPPHNSMRSCLCDLWMQQQAYNAWPLQCALQQLTSTLPAAYRTQELQTLVLAPSLRRHSPMTIPSAAACRLYNFQRRETPAPVCWAGINWSWTYEALATGLLHAADLCALYLLATHGEDIHSPAARPGALARGQTSAWEAVLKAWDMYGAWLNRVISASRMLSECVSAERSAEMMARGRPHTPTLADCGKAAFRSQVVLVPACACAAPGSGSMSDCACLKYCLVGAISLRCQALLLHLMHAIACLDHGDLMHSNWYLLPGAAGGLMAQCPPGHKSAC